MSGVGFGSRLCTCNCTSLIRAASAPHTPYGGSNFHPPLKLPRALCAGALTLDPQTTLLSGDAAAQLKSQCPQQRHFCDDTPRFLAELVQQSKHMASWLTSNTVRVIVTVTWDLPAWHHCPQLFLEGL